MTSERSTTSTVPAKTTFGVFGTTAILLVTDPAALPQGRALADVELAAVDLACSRFRPDSELSRLNAADSQLFVASELFTDLIATALRAAELTTGDVDPTCGRALVAAGYDRDFDDLRSESSDPPGRADPVSQVSPVPGWRSVWLDPDRRLVRLARGVRLDLGATAKAWAADRCAGLIAARLGCGVLVSLGGDIAVAGAAPSDGWQVKVTDDHAAADDVSGQVVTIHSGGLATSSTTVRTWTAGDRRMHHIIDPSTSEPVDSCWRTVSVAAGTCVDANIASTAAIIRGQAALSWLNDAGLPARLVSTDGSIRTTAGWPADPAN